MNWESVSGWFDYMDYLDLEVERASDGAVFVEVGVWLGRSTCYLADAVKRSGKKIVHYAVDNFAGSGCDGLDQTAAEYARSGKDLFQRWQENVAACGFAMNVIPIISDSADAARHFADGSVDFVFIDADHRREAVERDIRAWLPKMKPGGHIGGHDINRGEVEQAVSAVFGSDWRVWGASGMSWRHVVPDSVAVAAGPG